MTLKHNDLLLHALYKLSSAFYQSMLPLPKESIFWEKRKGQSCTSLPASGTSCEVFNSKHWGLRWARINDISTEHSLARTHSFIISKEHHTFKCDRG